MFSQEDKSQKGAQNYVTINGERLDLDSIVDLKPFSSVGIGKLCETFKANKPFPHIVFEGLFSPQLLELIYTDFDNLKWSEWARYDSVYEVKRGSVPNAHFPHATQLYFDTIYSGRFLEFISKISGIGGLITDPALFGGGMHEIPRGGKFEPHIDFNKHPVNMLDNRLTLITYLNKNWKSAYGGALELWDKQTDCCAVKVEPIFGRSILFYQSLLSLHGHPDPVKSPEGHPRRSLAAYYFTNGRQDIDTKKYHGTLYAHRFDLAKLLKVRANIRNFVPPVLYDLAAETKRYFWG